MTIPPYWVLLMGMWLLNLTIGVILAKKLWILPYLAHKAPV